MCVSRLGKRCWRCVLWAGAGLLVHTSISAEIVLDGTFGVEGKLSGPNVEIEEGFGQSVGGNLFHSFSEFNVNSGESATFFSSPLIENIISRISSENPSWLDGPIRGRITGTTERSSANIFLLNPNGVMFGPNAQLDVGGSFHTSTADYVSLGSDGKFYASPIEDSVLTISPPSEFGFFGQNIGSIEVVGASLEVPEDETLSLVAHDISITDKAYLYTQDGNIKIVAAGAGEISVDEPPVLGETIQFLIGDGNNVEISQESSVVVEGALGGSVGVFGDQVMLTDGASIESVTAAEGPGGIGAGIALHANNIHLTGEGQIISHNYGGGEGGTVSISAQSMSLIGDDENPPTGLFAISGVGGSSSGGGNSGDISIQVDELSMAGSSAIAAIAINGNGGSGSINIEADEIISIAGPSSGILTASQGEGGGGNIFIDTAGLDVREGTISTSTSGGGGDSGDVFLRADDVNMRAGAQISAGTLGSGNGGVIEITADTVSLSGRSEERPIARPTGLFATAQNSETGEGFGGDLVIHVDRLLVENGAQVSTGTDSYYHSGDLSIRATGSIHVSGKGAGIFSDTTSGGQGGEVTINAPQLILTNESLVQTVTSGAGDSGDLFINADEVILAEGAQIDVGTRATGDGGRLIINANAIDLSGAGVDEVQTGLFSSASNSGFSDAGRAGEMELIADVVNIKDGAVIHSGTDSVAQGAGLTLRVSSVSLSNEGLISSLSAGQGDAGNISIDSDEVWLSGNSLISTAAPLADGGDIDLRAQYMVRLVDSEITSAVSEDGNGGNITIDPRFVILDQSNIIANAEHGSGGWIEVKADYFFATPDSEISASAGPAGIDGTIVIDAPETNVSTAISAFPVDFIEPSRLLINECAYKDAKGPGSLFIRARDAGAADVGLFSSSVLDMFNETSASGAGDSAGSEVLQGVGAPPLEDFLRYAVNDELSGLYLDCSGS